MNKENKLIPGLPSGFEDRWGKKLTLKKKLINIIETNFVKFGFAALETPSFEISENIGSFLADDDSNPMSDVFSFKDGEKNITLRYDLSSPLARFVGQNNQELPLPYKRYQMGDVWRNEKAGNARYRSFLQCDADIVGNVNPAQANAELCNLIASTLLACGLKKDQFVVNISNRKIVQGLIEDLKISEDKKIKVMRAIDKLDKPGFGLRGVEDLLKKERVDVSGAVTKGADLTDDQASQIINFLKVKDLKELKENLKNSLSQEGIKELEDLLKIASYGDYLDQIKTNFTIVRGLAYYDGFCDPLLEKYAIENKYDLYILTDIDIPWVKDDLRDRPNNREEMFNAFKKALIKYNKPYVLVSGNIDNRMQIATKEIDELLKKQ